jgi:NADH:ubiquinone oxidoreductase subunit 5 (subunit L)/multisubunit Na+/H+ antiporter MnhA subunit
MEKLYNNFKISAIITGILIILAATWIILDYYVLKDALTEGSLFSSLEILMLNISIVVFIVLVISQIVTLIYSIRIALKARSMYTKVESEKENFPNTIDLKEPDKN